MFQPRISLRTSARLFSTNFRPQNSRRRNVAFASGAALTATLVALHHRPTTHADSLAAARNNILHPGLSNETSPSLATHIRTYAVYSMCSIPFLVDHAPDVLSVLRSVPGIRQLTDIFIRATFFSQFVGGDTAQQAIPVLQSLRAENKGTLLAYSVEHDGSASSSSNSRRIVDEIIQCIDVAAGFENGYAKSANSRRTWVAVKMTGLVTDASVLSALSAHILSTRKKDITFPGFPTIYDLDILNDSKQSIALLTPNEIHVVKKLHTDLVRVCTHAAKRGVKVIFDAEHSWYQPSIDALTYSLMRQFNKLADLSNDTQHAVQPLVYTTCQAYLRRTPEYLDLAIRDAKTHGYALGVKLVRGAYHPREVSEHLSAVESRRLSSSISPEAHPPVWSTKDATDACFDESARVLIRAVKDDIIHSSSGVPVISVIFATHNRRSCNLILDELTLGGLVSRTGSTEQPILQLGDAVTDRIALAQLYGMSDALSDYIVGKTRSSSPFVVKYVPYGALSEVIPYLGRRAIENKSILGEGSATEERHRALLAIRKRLFG